MPAYLGAPAAVGAKVITVFPGNHGTAFDSHQGAVLVFDTVHGSLQALLDASAITAIRTAAVSAVATRLLAREDADDLAILGSGVQARMHLEAIPLVRPIKRVRVWSRNGDHARDVARFASKHLGRRIEIAESAEHAVRGASIVCMTTSARQPVLHGDWLSPGTHVNAVGASTPDAREIDTQTVTRSRLYVDRRESALKEPGDILVPLSEGAITASHIVGELGELLLGTAVGRRDATEITLFKSLGLAIEDLAAAHHVVERARALGVGQRDRPGRSARCGRLRHPTLDAITAARSRIAGAVVRTPTIRLQVDAPFELWLKLENLQPIGSFKRRGALNAMRALPAEALRAGVYTASAGNMAQGVAWCARELAIPCTVLVPDHAPRTKLDAIDRLGARTVKLPFDDWWRVLVEHGYPGMTGTFIHPVSNADVIAGNATVGAEIAEDLGSVDAAFVPYGGGGLACGVAAALGSGTRVYACEVETAAPLSASLAAGRPVTIERRPSFVDGVGGQSVLAEMWPLARIAPGRTPSWCRSAAVATAVRLLVERARIVAEGAGGTAVAGALAYGSDEQSPGRRAASSA